MSRRRSRYHRDLMESYYLAREAWEQAAEAWSHGYATELAEYAELHPRPTFRSWLMGQERSMA